MRRSVPPSSAVLSIVIGVVLMANFLAGCGGSSASLMPTAPKAAVATATAVTSSLTTATSVGQAYSVTVSVSASSGTGAPTGTVVVIDGAGAACVATLTPGNPSTGSCTLISASVGTKTILATYSGDGTFLGSQSAGVAHLVNPSTQPAAIISPASAAFTIANAGTFTVAATGFPAPKLSETGALPSGLTFTDNGDGTATLTGTPASGTSGTYAVTFAASNGAGNNATQNFSLGVNGNFEFVTNNAGGNVTVIDLGANAATGQTVSLSAGATPQGISINPVDTLFGYVANGASKDVQVFCTRVEAAICPIQFGAPTIGGAVKATNADHAHVSDSAGVNPAPFSNTTDVVIASTGSFGFVVDNGAGMVYKIDTNRTSPTFNQILGPGIPISGAARADIRPAADFAYVADGKAEVVAINTSTGATTTIPISVTGTISYAVAASPDGNSVYVTDTGNGQVHVIGSASAPGVYSASTPTAGSIGGLEAGAKPHGIRFSPDGRFIYVADNANNVVASIDPTSLNVTGPGTVIVVNESISLTAGLAGAGPEGISPTGATDEILVAENSSNTASAVDGSLANTTFDTSLVTFGAAGSFNGPFDAATIPNSLLHIADPIPDGNEGAPYDWHLIPAGGTPPYAFNVTDGELPPGLSMDNTGHITGTPTTTGSFTFAIGLSEPLMAHKSQYTEQFNMEIFRLVVPLPGALPPATVNVPYSETITDLLALNEDLSEFAKHNTFFAARYSNFQGCAGLKESLQTASQIVQPDFGIAGTPSVAGICTFTFKLFFISQQLYETTLSIPINPAPTAMTFSSVTPNPSACNQPVSFTAVLSAINVGPPAFPTGKIVFSGGPACEDPVPGDVSTISGSCSFDFPTAGTYTITASYNGDNNFQPSMASIQQVVSCAPPAPAPTVTSVSGSPNPSIFGEPVTITSTVSPFSGTGTPTGSVSDSLQLPTPPALPIGNSPLVQGKDPVVISSLPVGADTIISTYSGDANFAVSTGTYRQTVLQASTATTASASANPVVVGQPIMLNAAVAPQFTGTPIGNVNFYDASVGATCSSLGTSVLLASNGVVNGTTSVGPLELDSAGTHTILVCYTGDTNFIGSSTTLTETVNKANTATTVLSSGNPIDAGQSVIFTANVGPVAPSTGGSIMGTVTFTVDGVPGPPISPAQGASFNTSSLSAGTHILTAAYSGDNNFIASDSAGSPFTETVNPALSIIERTPFGKLPDAFLGFLYSQTLEVSGGTAPLTFTISSSDFTNNVGNAGTACQGLSFNSSTGVLSGTPAMAGTCASGGFIVVSDVVHGPPLTANPSVTVRQRQAYVAGPGEAFGGGGPGTGDDTVEVIDTGAKSFVTSIDTSVQGLIPSGIALTRNGRFAFVNLNQTIQPFNNSRMLVIDTTTNSVFQAGIPILFKSCVGPAGVAIGAVPLATITTISRASGTATVTTAAPHGLAIQDLVAITGVTDATFAGTFDILSVPSATTFTYGQTAPDAGSGGGTVSSERAYVGCSNSEIGLIDLSASSGNPNDITPAGLTNLGTGNSTFDAVAITPDGSKVFATDSANGQFFVVATATNAVTGPFSLCTNPKGIAITPAGDRAYVACDANTIAVINTSTNAVSTIVTVNMLATDNWNDVAVTPDGTRVYATAANTGDFTVIDNTVATPAVIPASPINISGGALQGIAIPPLSPVPGSGLPVFIADSTTSPTTTSRVDIRDDSPILFPADGTSSISLTAGALNPAGTGAPIGIASLPVPYLFIASSSLSPAPIASTAYTSAPLAARGGVGPLTWSATSTGSACGSLSINASTGVISGTPGPGGSGTCAINVGVTDATAQMASAQIGFVL